MSDFGSQPRSVFIWRSFKPAVAIIALATFCVSSAFATEVVQTDVFTSGTDGYSVFRIPALVATTSGTLLAFAEGRRDSGSDTGRIDTVLRRSFDHGATWGPLQVVWSDGNNTCGNPAPVVDSRTGRIVLLGTWNHGEDDEKEISSRTGFGTRRAYVCYSTDDGATWGGRKEITAQVKKQSWFWYATGPGHGIQLEDGQLVIPANHTGILRRGHTASYAHVIISKDGGDTWTLGGSTGPFTNESTLVQLDDGRLILNSRSYHKLSRRAVSWSRDKGVTWEGAYLHPELLEPVCQASLLKVQHEGRSAYLFSNPKSKKRENLTVRISRDEGQSWSAGLTLHPGFSGYSDLCSLPGENVGCLYERDLDGQNYGRITFAVFAVESTRVD